MYIAYDALNKIVNNPIWKNEYYQQIFQKYCYKLLEKNLCDESEL